MSDVSISDVLFFGSLVDAVAKVYHLEGECEGTLALAFVVNERLQRERIEELEAQKSAADSRALFLEEEVRVNEMTIADLERSIEAMKREHKRDMDCLNLHIDDLEGGSDEI